MGIMKIWMFLLLIIVLLSAACKNDKSRMADLLKMVDTIRLNNFWQGSYDTTIIRSTKGIKIFIDIIHLKKENLSYSKMFREIEYFSKGKLVLKASESKEGIEYAFNGEIYSERIGDKKTGYYGDPSFMKHQDFTPTPNNPLEARIYKLKLQHIVFGCVYIGRLFRR